ncbi:hypothetical protein [Micromonospora sp. URMC 103]|uniref:hypothetical protein n=1 Tax=Micromonospora sp. URMC 103 TaxID=3423406 RepID=UPI003F1D50A5
MTARWSGRCDPGPADVGRQSRRTSSGAGRPTTKEPERRHEVLVAVRLTTATPGSRLLEHLRGEPCAVAAWWIAADVDAVVRLSAASLTTLHRAIADLRRRAGAEVVVTHTILRALDLSVAGPAADVTGPAAVTVADPAGPAAVTAAAVAGPATRTAPACLPFPA